MVQRRIVIAAEETREAAVAGGGLARASTTSLVLAEPRGKHEMIGDVASSAPGNLAVGNR
ncbi:MAG TPA: hypothetical protein VGI60_10035 [Chthoniobacterales bacterium]|jgi:hypothetical protein